MNIRSLDLNLLLALKVLLEERHVSRAAEKINLSQPAMSRALGRLRKMFDDPLLVKSQQGMVLTVRASELIKPLQLILHDIKTLVEPVETNPANMRGEMTIATRDNEMVTILPALIKAVTEQAPNLRLNVVALRGNDFSPLEQMNVDFILSGTESTTETLHRFKVLDDGFICLVDKNHVKYGTKLTLQRYCQMKHCLVTIDNVGKGLVDELLAKKQLSRTVAVRVPYFLAVPYIIAQSDLIVTLPARLGKLFANHNDIICLQPPLEIPSFPIYLYWHPKNHVNPTHQWIRELIRSAVTLSQ